MADKSDQGKSSASGTDEDSSKWQPYWDETYKRYYWSDGNESVRFFCRALLRSFELILLGLGNTERLCRTTST